MDQRLDVAIEVAGSMLWLAPHGLGGHAPDVFGQAWMGTPVGGVDMPQLIAQQLFMPLVLMQGDDFIVRWVLGDLQPEEQDDWMACARGRLSVACGRLMCAGVLTPDFARFEYPSIEAAEPGGSSQFGHYINVPPGDYDVTVYSYPPRELSGAWDALAEPGKQWRHPAIAQEDPVAYFKRTRPGEALPQWLAEPDDNETLYVQFVIHVQPATGEAPPASLDDSGGLAWTFRKPERCPLTLLPAVLGDEDDD